MSDIWTKSWVLGQQEEEVSDVGGVGHQDEAKEQGLEYRPGAAARVRQRPERTIVFNKIG